MTTAATATPEPDLKSLFLALMPSAVPWQPEDTEELKDAREKRRNEDKATSPSTDENKGRGAEVLIPFMDEFPLYLNESGESLILFNDSLYVLDPKNKELAEDLGLFYHEKTGKPLSKDAASTSISLYSAKARRDGTHIEIFNRSGEKDGGLYIDLGNNRTVEISPGSWRIVPTPLFMKLYNHQQPQPDPLPGGDAWKLFDFIRVPEESRLLCLATIATCFIARINHPAISISGPQGSGKSFAQSIIKQIVDPSSMTLSMMPRKVEELPLLLSRNHMTALDNQSSFSGEVADLLCAAITGGVLEKRVLHTDSDMLSLRVPGIITYSAITSVSDRPDLHERTVRFVLDRIPPQERRTEKAIWREFNEALPSILGGIFDLIAKAMAIQPGVEDHLLELPRMADFACWAFSICEAMPGKRVRKMKITPENNRRLRYLSFDEIAALLKACDAHLHPVVAFALNTGCRRNEILGLTWDRVDLKHGFILLDDTKTGKRREIPINANVRAVLKGIVRRLDIPYVFVNPDTAKERPPLKEGGKRRPASGRYYDLKNSFATACRKAGIRDFHFHDCRHTFASQLVMNGVDITTVAKLLGHATLTMTLRYAHLAPNHLQNAVDVLSNLTNSEAQKIAGHATGHL